MLSMLPSAALAARSVVRPASVVARSAAASARAIATSAHPTSSGTPPPPSATTPGSLFVWGNNREGALGNEAEKQQLVPCPQSVPEPLVHVACGTTHTVAVAQSGHVYTWGKNEYGALGLRDGLEPDAPPLQEADRPTLVDVLAGQKIVHVSANSDHTVAVGEDGDVYTWGWGGSFFSGYGGLGHGNKTQQDFPGLVETLYEEGKKVVQTAAGKKHTLALTAEGEVLVWGDGEFGRLGNGRSSAPVPEPLEELAGVKCVHVAAGEAFSAAVSAEGELWMWGRNDQSQLGLGANLTMDVNSLEEFPMVNTFLAKIGPVANISLGRHHAVAVMQSGAVYQWGGRQFIEPQLLSTLDDRKIIQAAAGDDSTVLLADDGGLYSFGKNRSRYTLGHGVKSGVKHPQRIAYFDDHGISIRSISMGMHHCAAVVGTPKA